MGQLIDRLFLFRILKKRTRRRICTMKNMGFKYMILLYCLLAPLYLACEEEDETFETDNSGEKEPTYGIAEYQIDAHNTHLRQIHNNDNNGTAWVPICIYATYSFSDSLRDTIYWDALSAAREWIAPLQGEPGWTTHTLNFWIAGDKSSCPDYDKGQRTLKIFGNSSAGDGGASVADLKITEGTDFFKDNVNGWRNNHIKHEYGHLLAIADTYSLDDYNQPIGQPNAVMDDTWNNEYLTPDDQAAVRNVWRMIYTGSGQSCGPGYELAPSAENAYDYVFCIPSGSCNDNRHDCSSRAQKGWCLDGEKDEYVTQDNCCESCKSWLQDYCPNDKNDWCFVWAMNGECNKTPDYMLTNCPCNCSLMSSH